MENQIKRDVHYWIYSPGENADHWEEFNSKGIMAIGWGQLGDLSKYSSRAAMGSEMKKIFGPEHSVVFSSLATWQFYHEMQIGDIIFVKKGMYKLIGCGVVTSDYIYDSNCSDDFKHTRKVNWTHIEEKEHPGQAVMKTLTDITEYTEYVKKLNALYEINNTDEELEKEYPSYSKDDFLKDVFIDEEKYNSIIQNLERKNNIILQGAPGVGKTFAAKRIAYSILNSQDSSKVKLVQFHQSYSYEDFIMGYRPSDEADKQFEKKPGVFYEFCKKAQDDADHKYFFIIDEINRGNLSKIFGELLMLIEKDKRGESIQLLYSNEQFSIPSNLYIIGMMNTTDRSLAIIDYALRRRFAFIEFEPAFDSEGFKSLQSKINNEKYNSLINSIKELNSYIENDSSLGKGFKIGHSYFIPGEDDCINDQWLKNIIKYEIVPLLEEYWFDNPDEISNWSKKLQDAIN